MMEAAGKPAVIIMDVTNEMLEQIKTHLRVDDDSEDQLIIAYAQAAADYVEKYCDGSLVTERTLPADSSLREILFTQGIWAAMLLLIGHWYANREAAGQSLSDIPFGVDSILFLHRKWN